VSQTDTSEKGLETLIMLHMTGVDGLAPVPEGMVAETPDAIEAAKAAGSGWLAGNPKDYDRTHTLDVSQLFHFLQATQPETLKKLGIAAYKDAKDINRQKFLARLSNEIGKRGVIDVLRKGIEHHPVGHFDLFYGTPTPGNAKAAALFAKNRFSVTRQLRYSPDETRRALDLCLFINGLPFSTFELKNSLTKQTVEDAIEQYRRDRDPREKLFEFGRCVVHFAVDDAEVRMCTELRGKGSWFLPFNKGWNDGAGNPPNPAGLKTDYLWKEVLTPGGLTNILENYAQIVEQKHPKTGRKKRKQVFPRYHQLDVVHEVLAHVSAHGPGARYLIEHSAGSGKSNSIAWLAHQLIALKDDEKEIFDSVIVVTDRRILDDQIQKTVKQFMQVGATVGHAEHSGDLRKFIEEGKKIIISTVQKFPFILDEIEKEAKGKTFAIIIDEAHSSQGGKTSSAMSAALADPEDTVNDALEKRMQARKMLTNASYFAFTATPKNKTLEMFGHLRLDEDGQVDFKGKAKTFARTYDFLASVLPYTNREWERLSIVLNLLIPKLPAPRDEDLSKGILEAIDMDSYRVEKRAVMKIALPDDNAEIGPVPVEGGGHKREPELDRLSNILKAFNDHFGTLFADADRVARRIKEDIAPKVAADQSYRNAKQNTPNSARIEHDKALSKVMLTLLKDDTQVYKQFVENESFRRFVTDMVFTMTNA
jgi:type I restriction enzyme R subunit